jgi:dipeptidyl aminopeptidase/acylaminoacyl peptidase
VAAAPQLRHFRAMPITRPYGAWSSPITSESITRGALVLGQPTLDGERVVWLERRPDEGGRQVVVAAGPGGRVEDLSPADANVRTRVHEYGGGDFCIGDGALHYVDFADQLIHGTEGVLGSPGSRYADLERSPDGRQLLAVEETPHEDREESNRLVAINLDGGKITPFAEGHDFVSFPRFAPDGRSLVYTSWSHPHMPWDETQLWLQPWSEGRPVGSARLLAGQGGESILQPRFSPDGKLTFISDRSGWWNLHQLDLTRGDAEARALCPVEAEFSGGQWIFGLSNYDFIDETTILCAYGVGGEQRLARLDVASGRLDVIPLSYSVFASVHAEAERACFIAASPSRAPEVVLLDLASDSPRVLRAASDHESDSRYVSLPETISFASQNGRTAHAFYYAPCNPDFEAPEHERPPLLVKSHGGPTSSTSASLNLGIQYWTSRGFAVVDVNYGGSTGYGRAYRELLKQSWGIVDVEDCVAAAESLAARGVVDRERMAISGGSAGGYTTLAALTFHDVFRAGASHYGIGNLESLAEDTHKFESRYLDSIVAPWPEGKAIYRERSPLFHSERLSCPVIFFQGLEDRVVPPNQAEEMVTALARRGIPHAHVTFEGEQHGFRKSENIQTALDGELYFYSRIFGFEVEKRPTAVKIVGLT